MLHPIIEAKMPLLKAIFKSHKIKSAYAFGSVTNDSFNDESDIDFLISFEDTVEVLETGDIWWKLHDNLRDILNREVDLLIEKSLKNPYFIEEVNEKKQLIYAA
jgi:predicted nucleotidyltransferase